MELPGRLTATPSAPVYCIFNSASTQITSSCLFWLNKCADTAEAAIEAVEKTDLPMLQVALSIRVPKQPYRLQVLWAERGGQRRGAQSATLGYIFWNELEIPDEAVTRAALDMNLLASDPVMFEPIHHLTDAVRQKDTASTPKEQEAALLSYFKVIESMTRFGSAPEPPQLERKQRREIEKLKLRLESSSKIPENVKAIREASDELRRLENDFLTVRIAAMARSLGLPEKWEKAAIKFAYFRNRRLGHAGPPTTPEERRPWLDNDSAMSAWELARAPLVAYVDRPQGVRSKKKGDPAARRGS